MNLQALYDLKERLEHAAIAGTGLLQEDFRLRRAVEALTPLAAASPVFSKISTGASALLQAPEQERSARLLDVLSLVDAVVYTQGTTNLSGELVEPEPGSGSYVQASYGQLQPLLAALSGTGSGRTSVIRDYWTDHPEYFGDFRVLPHVVSALGDNYAELAQLICEILLKQGSSVIALLKQNFDPAGKTEMARRVRLIAQLAGQDENDWFTAVLPDSKKDVREALIQVLSLSKENNQLLLDLCRTEMGKLKEAALRSLAAMDTEEAAEFWKKEIQKKPNTVACLNGVSTLLAADLCAARMRAFLENLLIQDKKVYDQSDLEQLTMLTAVNCGKYSTDLDSLWSWIAEHMDIFSQILPDKNIRSCDLNIAEHLQKALMQTILWNFKPELQNMARALGESSKEWFLGCAMVADMADMSAAELYDTYAPYVVPMGIAQSETVMQLRCRIQIMQVLSIPRWHQVLRAHCIVTPVYDAISGLPIPSIIKLDGVDPRWVILMTDPKVRKYGSIFTLGVVVDLKRKDPAIDEVITALVNPDNPEVCRLAGEWFYAQMMKKGNIHDYFPRLLLCGWSNWKGVFTECAKKNGIHSYDMVVSMLRKIPMTNIEKADELKQLNWLADCSMLKIQYGKWPKEWALRQITILESDPNAEI